MNLPLPSTRLMHIGGLMLAMFVWLANNSNPPTGRTGAPFDGSCNDCHSGGSFQGTVEVSGMPATIDPNMTYPLTVTVTPTGGSPVRGGFQLVVVDGSNTNCGNLANSNAQSGTEFFGGREYLEHRGAKTFSGNPVSWNFTWASPATAGGNTVKIYMIGNFTNGNGGTGGDNAISALETYNFASAPAVTATITSTTNVSCNGGNNGSATVEGGGGTPPYTYLWSNGQTQATAVNLTAGTYTATVTGSSGSGSATATAVITQPPAITLSATPAGSLTCANNSVNVTANAGGGAGGFSFAWSNGDTGNPATYFNPGTGSVVATDVNGCTKTASFNINTNTTPPNASASASGSFNCTNNATLQLSGAGSSTGAGISYLWTAGTGGIIISGGITLTPTVQGCATYTLQVTNTQNGCTATASVTPTCDVVPPNASATGATITCANTTVVIMANSTTSPVTYAWAGPGGFTSNQQNPSVSSPGVYTVTVRNSSNNCTATATATVSTATASPNASASGGTLTCASTSVTLMGSSSTPGVTYSWAGPGGYSSNQQNPGVSVAGTYTLTVYNPTNGCTATATAAVSSNTTPPNASASGGTLTCASTSVTLMGSSSTPGVTYSWAGPGGYSSNQQNPGVSVAGTYTLTVNSPANGCTATATATVSTNTTPPNATASGGTLTCASTSVTLMGSSSTPGVTYFWAGPGGYSSNQQNPSVSTIGTYTLTVNNPANGCTSSATASVGQNITAPNDTIIPPPHFNCLLDTIVIDASPSSQGPNFVYQWTAALGGHIVSGDTSLTPKVDSAGRYYLLITNTVNGCTALDSANVTHTPPITLSVNATAVSCFGGNNGSATALAGGGNGPFDYLWSNGDTSAVSSNLSSGTYAVSVTDADGCTASGSTFVSQPFALQPNATTTGETGVGFHDGTATAAPAGGTAPYTYLWSNDSTTATISGLAPGNYTVSVSDANGCTAVQTVTVNAFGCNLSLAASATPITCHGAADGTATVSVSGANGAVNYSWSSGATTQTASNLGPGTYTVSVVDASNCEAVQTVQVNEPALLLPNATATGQSGLGLEDGTATAAPTGGTAPYTYLWSNGGTTPTISGLAPNTYTVVVTDSKGCTASQSVTVSGFNCALALALSAQSPRCFGSADGVATATVSGATGLVTYAWSNGGSTATIVGLSAGTYTAIVSDAAGCTASSSVSISQPQPLTATVSDVVHVACPLNATGSAVVIASGGTAPYGYGWPAGNGNGTGLQAGSYTVSITDSHGCQTTASVVIASLDTQAPSIGCPGNIVNCGADVINYNYPFAIDNCSPGPIPELVSGQDSGTPFNDGVTVQVFRATDLSGNSATCSFSVTIYTLADIVVTGSGPDTNGLGVGFIHIQLAGTGPFTYVWLKDGQFYSNEQNLDGLKAGSYRLNVTDGNGCLVQLAPIIISNTVGTDDPAALAGLRLWPNPVQASFRVELNGLELASAAIYTPQGRLVCVLQPAALSDEVEVSDLPAGVYYLRVSTQQGWQGALRWVKAGQ